MAACEKWFCAVQQEVVAKHLAMTPSFLLLFSRKMKRWSHPMNLTLKTDVFCLSWTFSSCSWNLLSNWTSIFPIRSVDWILTWHWHNALPVAFHRRFLLSCKSFLHHLRINEKLCISTRTFVVFLVYLEWNKWNSCQATVVNSCWLSTSMILSCFWNNVLASSSHPKVCINIVCLIY